MFNGSIEIENNYKYPKVRLFTAGKEKSSKPEDELLSTDLKWSIVSAVCCLYDRMIQSEVNERPLVLVHKSWDG
jgi:hypothetical protein